MWLSAASDPVASEGARARAAGAEIPRDPGPRKGRGGF